MVLNDIYDALAYGELAHLFIAAGAVPAEGIPQEKRKQLLSSVQLGLTELHKRFVLRESELTINLVTDKQYYLLAARYAQSNTASVEAVKYIDDSVTQFQDDLLKVERVYAADGTELPLNMLDDPDSVKTPAYNSILIPSDLEGDTIKVVYRANHPLINVHVAYAAPSVVQIDLPHTHLEALLNFIASRVHRKPGSVTEYNEGNIYLNMFNASCALLETHGFSVENRGMNDRLERNGWV